ncbi:MAG: short-chain dehydrogenase [Chloroflexi bacterium]|nr:short-chain dehydrogenase [Chloroflexota bacterium]|tara:strand:- start:6517 stop:7308 length:792 start_codon:yes stop_codon:yes gene_type:complete
MDLGLNGKNAIITGGSDGIGLSAAISLSREGANVAILARTQEKLDNAVKEIEKDAKGKVMAISTDIRDEASVNKSINQVRNEFGKIDILVNNAGTSSASPLEEMTNEQLTEDLNLKVYGAIYCARAVIEDMKSTGSGSIVNITTPGGKATAGGSQPTSLSRAAGISLTKAWSKEYASQNIRVNTVCVGLLKSGQHRTRVENIQKEKPDYTLEDHWEIMGKNVPMGRVGEAIEVGNVICFLSSSKASYVTGTAVNVDGGTSPVV